MNKDLDKILADIFSNYESQIGRVCIVTNGTLLFNSECIKLLSFWKNKVLVVISNYGPNLSKKINEVVEQCEKSDIPYRLEEYYDDSNLKYGGWLDYRDHSLKHYTEEQIINQAKSCFFRQGKYYEINNGEIHLCSRSFYRMMKGIIPKNEEQYIDLLHPKQSIEEDKEKMLKMDKLIYLDSCAYCEGNRSDRIRYKPAEQL